MRKSPPARPDARSLVHSVMKKRVEFLGAQINSKGHVYIPADKVRTLEAKVAHREKYCTIERENPYYGYSTFSVMVPPGEQRGRYRFDPEDLGRIVSSFKKYWETLGAINLTSSMDKLPCLVSIVSAGSDPVSHPWVACLGLTALQEARSGSLSGCVTRSGSGQTVSLLPNDLIRLAWEADPIASRILDDEILSNQDDGSSHDSPLGMSWDAFVKSMEEESDGNGTSTDAPSINASEVCDESDSPEVPTEDESEPLEEDEPARATSWWVFQEAGYRSEDHLYPGMGEALSLGSGGHRDGYPSYSSGTDQSSCDHEVSRDDSSFRFSPGSLTLDSDRVRSDQYDPAPPPLPVTLEGWELRKRDIYLGTRYLRDRRCHRIVWQVIDDELGHSLPPRTYATRGRRLEAELVRLLTWLVQEAAQAGVDVLVVRMESNRLGKTLLQRTSAVRSPRYFEALRDLHVFASKARVHVLIGGPAQLSELVLHSLNGGHQ